MMDEDEIDSVKIALLGSAGVGKTSIIVRYVDDAYSDNSLSTDGVGYSQKFLEVGDKKIKLDIWDTSGQEQYRSLGKHFYKDAYIVCLVYDITRYETFKDIKEVWYADLKKFGEKFTILAVVGAKSDCYEKEKVNENEARDFAKEIGAIYQLTSSKNSIGINELFENLAKLYLDPDFFKKVEEIREQKGNISMLHKKDLKKIKKKDKKCCGE